MVTKTIDVHELQKNLKELVSQVTSGTEIIFTEGKTPVARLVPISQRVAGLHSGLIMTGKDFDEPLPDDFWIGEKA
ncbi:MAG: toxin-antitoxin (TA) system antitoxin [Anaerolinea sp.]|nr:toxin-antitoxin (TA) system antitoxin [Anaerolinea sp.]